jgi:hypothetical protein
MIDADAIRQRFQAVAPFLDERGRRLVAASEVVAQQAQDHRVSHSLLGDLLNRSFHYGHQQVPDPTW